MDKKNLLSIRHALVALPLSMVMWLPIYLARKR